MAKVTVINNQRYKGQPAGNVIEVDDSPVVRGLLRDGKLSLVDPPSLEILDGVQSGAEAGADQELSDEPKRTRRKGSRKASAECPPEGEGTSASGSGNPEGLSADSADHTEGEAYSESS